MVHQNLLVLDEAQREVLESGGGAAETTKAKCALPLLSWLWEMQVLYLL